MCPPPNCQDCRVKGGVNGATVRHILCGGVPSTGVVVVVNGSAIDSVATASSWYFFKAIISGSIKMLKMCKYS